jgi:hypothetical protein
MTENCPAVHLWGTPFEVSHYIHNIKILKYTIFINWYIYYENESQDEITHSSFIIIILLLSKLETFINYIICIIHVSYNDIYNY